MSFPKFRLFVKVLASVLVSIGCASGPGFQNDFDQINLSNLESSATERYIQIHIETEADVAEKIKIAEDVIERVEPGLKVRISSRFPNVKSWQLDTISITPKSERLYWLQTASWTHDVYIEIRLNFSGDEAWAILQFCADEVHVAIQNASQSSP